MGDHGKRNSFGVGPANLSGTHLAGVIWADTDLRGMNLSGSNLSSANLRGAHLAGANLSGANLQDAVLTDAKLEHANLSGSNLAGLDLRWACLEQANLSQSNLQHVNLEGADLRGANLCGARLEEAMGLTQCQVELAHIDRRTQLPATLPIVWLSGDRYLLGEAARKHLDQTPPRNPLRVIPKPLSPERLEELFGPMAGCGMTPVAKVGKRLS